MSGRTCGVAVAVSATVGGQPSRSRTPRDREVARAEIVPPFADAVRLVDRKQRDAASRAVRRRAEVESLRREVEEFHFAALARAGDRRFDPDSVLLTNVAGSPRAASASTWSFISEISGDRTTVSFGSNSAGT